MCHALSNAAVLSFLKLTLSTARDKKDANSLMDYPNEWEEIENAYDADHYSDRPLQGANIEGFSLSDFLIIKNWIGYARGIDDPSVAGFSYSKLAQIGFGTAKTKSEAFICSAAKNCKLFWQH